MGYASPDHQSQQGGPACAQTVKTDAPSGGAHTIRACLPVAAPDKAVALLPDHVSYNIEATRRLHLRADEI
jgi:hypothetical protein